MPSPCTVTGNLLQLSNGIIANGQVIFELANIGTGNPITITGTGIFPALKYAATSQANGSFTLNLWGNDNINPANTIYNVTYRDTLGNEVGPIQYSITGVSANLNTLAASSTTTPPVLTVSAFQSGIVVPSGTINGINTIFTLSPVPVVSTVLVFLNGLLQQPGGGNDYTIAGATITFAVAPPTSSLVLAVY